MQHRLCIRRLPTFRCFSSSRVAEDKFKILFLGRDEFSCTVFKELHGAEDLWDNIQIVTNPDERVGRRGSLLSVSPLKTLGLSLGTSIHEIPHEKNGLKSWRVPAPFTETPHVPQHLLVTASFGRILPYSFLSLFAPLQRLNVHPSLLPKYRGPAPIQHAILNGESETGISVICMMKRSEGIDAGRILSNRKVAMPENASHADMRQTLALQGGKLLVATLREMQAGKINAVEQSGEPTLAPLITFEDSVVDFKTMTACSIVRRHRAISHQRPITANTLNNSTVQFHNVAVSSNPPHLELTEHGMSYFDKLASKVYVRCAENTILEVPQLKADGKALSEAKDWWNGVKGLRLVKEGRYHFA